MSDTTAKRLKVSREGVVLIKSFEGFRAAAQPRPEGGWVIGYGHTRSAREGLTVSEADAELLLQYDLLPVVAALNERLPGEINQHQFDALASYAFSIGLERFQASPVLERLNAGAVDEAADAMVGAPEVAPPDAVLRRRAAERALFVAEPGAPVTLAQLMSAPLPLPQVVTASALEEGAQETEAEVQNETAPVEVDAVSAPADEAALDGLAPVAAPAPDATVEEAEAASVQPVIDAEAADPISNDADTPGHEPAITETDSAADTAEPVVAPAALRAAPEAAASPASVAMATNLRLSPYAGMIVGPIPNLGDGMTALVSAAAPALAPTPTPLEDEPPVPPLHVVAEPAAIDAAQVEPAVMEAPSLVLTPPDDAHSPVLRPVWTEAERVGVTADESPLFEEVLQPAASAVLRHEAQATPQRTAWSETGAFAAMGGIGLISFGAAMAGFRKAAEQGADGDRIGMVGWVLVVIALICVGVSGYNLFRIWTADRKGD